MSIYFIFSDEAGQYKKERNEGFLRVFPYYLRATCLLQAEDWKKLKNKIIYLKRKNSFPIDKEIKWSYLWSLKKHRNNNEEIPQNRDYKFLENVSEETILKYIEDILVCLNELDFFKCIFTFTLNRECAKIEEEHILKFHLQDIMQRVEMELNTNSSNLGIMFIDPTNKTTNKMLKNIYHTLFCEGDFISKYKNIKDSVVFENSHQSYGIQVADYLAGIMSGTLNKYDESVRLFNDYIYSKIRRNNKNEIEGYGIIEIPKNEVHRSKILKLIEESIPNNEVEDDFPF